MYAYLGSYDLEINLVTSILDADLDTLKMYLRTKKMKFLGLGIETLECEEETDSDTQTDLCGMGII